MNWNEYYQKEYKALIGRKIVGVKAMTDGETREFYWDHHRNRGAVFVLDNGDYFIPMEDDEGNGPGALYFPGRG